MKILRIAVDNLPNSLCAIERARCRRSSPVLVVDRFVRPMIVIFSSTTTFHYAEIHVRRILYSPTALIDVRKRLTTLILN